MKSKGFALILGALVVTGCTPLTTHSVLGSEEGGYVSINADAAGMRAFSDWNTGVINETKTPEGSKGSYYQLREVQEAERTKRFGAMFGKGGSK